MKAEQPRFSSLKLFSHQKSEPSSSHATSFSKELSSSWDFATWAYRNKWQLFTEPWVPSTECLDQMMRKLPFTWVILMNQHLGKRPPTLTNPALKALMSFCISFCWTNSSFNRLSSSSQMASQSLDTKHWSPIELFKKGFFRQTAFLQTNRFFIPGDVTSPPETASLPTSEPGASWWSSQSPTGSMGVSALHESVEKWIPPRWSFLWQ